MESRRIRAAGGGVLPRLTAWWCFLHIAAAAAGTVVSGPEQVITWQDGALVPNISSSWRKLRGPVGTVCVTGDDRVGKSTLLTLWGRNVSHSEDFSFSVGSGKKTHTRGIWSAVMPADATGLGYHLNLCDSQGLKQIAELQQWRLFSANVLLPSVLVYMVINVVQNDQLRDLARMAHQFLQLSRDEFGRFRETLSPHLIVVVREENDNDSESEVDYNLTAHLEDALSGPGYEEDKELVRKVFQKREAWSLARRVKSDAVSLEQWRNSAEVVLGHMLSGLEARQLAFPQGGPELVEWYNSVLDTVNSREDGSMGRLVGLSEQIITDHLRRDMLAQWRKPIHMTLAVLALFLGFGGFLGRSLDKVAWCVWVALCVCYVGTSPFVTTPLRGIVPKLCEQAIGDTNILLVKAVCTEVSSQTAAVVVAAVLGVLSYPLLIAQFRWLLELFPLPKGLQKSGATLLLSAAFAALGILGEIDMSEGVDADTWLSLGARAVLMVNMIISGTQFAVATRVNYAAFIAGATGRALHFYVAARVREVQELESSKAWNAHFRSSQPHNSLWRYRYTPAWWHMPLFMQAGALLIWAYIIRPHCDVALGAGVAINFLYLLWRMGGQALRKCRLRDKTDIWWKSLEDDDSGSEGDDSAHDSDAAAATLDVPETAEEESVRREIECMRREQEPNKRSNCSWLRLLFWLSVLSASIIELLRRAGYNVISW